MKKIATTVSLLIVITTLGVSTSWSQLRKIKVSFPAFVASFAPLFMAKEKGFYAEEGLDAEFLVMRGFLSVQALLAGESQFSTGATAFTAIVKGMDVRVVMFLDDKPWAQTLSKPGIKTVQDLKGKTVATSGPGSAGDAILRRALKLYGLEPEKEVTIVTIAGTPDRVKALEAGTIDAAILIDVYTLMPRKKGFNVLIDHSKVVPMPWDSINTMLKTIREEPELVKKFVRATLRGMRYMPGNKEDGVRAIAKYTKLDPDFLREAYEELVGMYSKDGRIPDKTLELTVEINSELAGVKEKISKDKVVDYRFLD